MRWLLDTWDTLTRCDLQTECPVYDGIPSTISCEEQFIFYQEMIPSTLPPTHLCPLRKISPGSATLDRSEAKLARQKWSSPVVRQNVANVKREFQWPNALKMPFSNCQYETRNTLTFTNSIWSILPKTLQIGNFWTFSVEANFLYMECRHTKD